MKEDPGRSRRSNNLSVVIVLLEFTGSARLAITLLQDHLCGALLATSHGHWSAANCPEHHIGAVRLPCTVQ